MLLNGISPSGKTIQIPITNVYYILMFYINIIFLNLIKEKGFSWEPKRNMVVNLNNENFCKVFKIFYQKVLKYVLINKLTVYAISIISEQKVNTTFKVNTTSEKETFKMKRSKNPKVLVASL